MNIIKIKKVIATALTFVIFMALVQPPLLTAKERRGSTVEVILIDWHRVKGELLAVKGHDLVIYDKSRDQGFTVNIEQVSRIWLKKKSRFFSGIALGLITGVGLGAIWYACTTERDEFREFALILPSFATIPLGGLIGAIQGLSVKLPIKGEEPAYIEECLQYLQQYARY
ncbi:MAG: hypothetical protein L6428_00300 [Candidatus Aminicenantes bacterium]|nr:hypothetical protein [Acidobacteriota bacterium]MCG2809882.1 hypothetical protein [Candidatus Aminicenantes bacterium]